MLIKILTIALLAECITIPALAQAQTKPFVKEQKSLTFHPPILCRTDCDFGQVTPSQLEIYQTPLFLVNSDRLLEKKISATNSFSLGKTEVIRR